jgi:hypothetical protein
MTTIDEVTEHLNSLTPQSLDEVQRFVEYLRWKQDLDAPRTSGRSWVFDFVENLPRAEISSEGDPAGMEVTIGEAACSGDTRMALWQHPPVLGSAIVEFQVPVPSVVQDLYLHFSSGIRDGSQLAPGNVVAFRIFVDGWKIWSDMQQTREWKPHRVPLPALAGDVARIQFVTDGLGNHEWAWAVWAEPRLTGSVAE